MPVKYFISQDLQAKKQIQNDSQEILAVINIIKRIYTALNHHQNLYAMIANLRKIKAMTDLVVFTERGFGVMELRHESDSISMRGTAWYAGSKPIPGNLEAGYRNPHEQVQMYASLIRAQLLDIPQDHPPWLPGKPAEWERFQFGTAVCFTHKKARLDRFPFWHYKKSPKNPHIKAWEQFSILTPPETPGWVDTLNFEGGKRRKGTFEPYRLTVDQILRIVTEIFGATEWTEIDG